MLNYEEVLVDLLHHIGKGKANHKEIAKHFNINEERVIVLERKAIKKLLLNPDMKKILEQVLDGEFEI